MWQAGFAGSTTSKKFAEKAELAERVLAARIRVSWVAFRPDAS